MLPSQGISIDDWGMHPSINEATLYLIKHKKVESVSVITNLPHLSYGLDALLESKVPLSIHINLTVGRPLTSAPTDINGNFYSLRKFLLRNLLRNPAWIKQEAAKQVELALMHKIPIACLDGHQHIHLLPKLFSTFCEIAKTHKIPKVRFVSSPQHIAYWLGLWSKTKLGKFKLTPSYVKTHDSHLLGIPLLRHPATYSDWSQDSIYDGCPEARLKEFLALKHSWGLPNE